ncbi:uncharacterized protein LAESUDRAFT_728715 [Laetiporus sulphureus 93-53]|uniref:Uncharacterized protein n=1 Tax=Laetiporus sulphureus 93-53 TaxID=1314785 RepID=A0A165D224_9APHY|nr:uncharacterized protein LAESUDRAFT_728715 [Laetiporus sulphureus 93-53]KZT04000.1 hypothetical protein LAESUDRAFT_728715 [Laetiporus sulphureus 93-53]
MAVGLVSPLGDCRLERQKRSLTVSPVLMQGRIERSRAARTPPDTRFFLVLIITASSDACVTGPFVVSVAVLIGAAVAVCRKQKHGRSRSVTSHHLRALLHCYNCRKSFVWAKLFAPLALLSRHALCIISTPCVIFTYHNSIS